MDWRHTHSLGLKCHLCITMQKIFVHRGEINQSVQSSLPLLFVLHTTD